MQFNEIYEVTTNEDKNEYYFTTSLNYHYMFIFYRLKKNISPNIRTYQTISICLVSAY